MIRKICIICEGYEELEYFNALINKAVFSSKYKFVLINSKSINNISSIYQNKYQSNSYDLVLVFCDTDKDSSISYKRLKEEINIFHGNDVASDLVIYGNPCTMQIIILHFCDVKLTSQSKGVNSKYIEEYVGIVNYKATEKQRKELFGKIKRSNYKVLKDNLKKYSMNDRDISSTNILKFLELFECDDSKWIDDINNKL